MYFMGHFLALDLPDIIPIDDKERQHNSQIKHISPYTHAKNCAFYRTTSSYQIPELQRTMHEFNFRGYSCKCMVSTNIF